MQLYTVKVGRKFSYCSVTALAHGFHDRLHLRQHALDISRSTLHQARILRCLDLCQTLHPHTCLLLQFIAMGLNFDDGSNNVVHILALTEQHILTYPHGFRSAGTIRGRAGHLAIVRWLRVDTTV